MNIIYVGIDTSKDKHDICVKDEKGTVLAHLKIRNTHSDLKRLYQRLDTLKQRYAGCRTIFGMEATGIYYLALYHALVNDGYPVKVYNPLQSSGYRRLELRKTKTDQIDAGIIADMLRYSEEPPHMEIDLDLYMLRELCRIRHRIVKKITDCKRQITRDLDMLWPGYSKHFSKTFVKTSCTILKRYPVPSTLTKQPFEDFCQLLNTSSRGQLNRRRAEEIYENAKETLSIPALEPAGSKEIKLLITQLELLQKQKERLEKHIKKIFLKKDTKITTIPGIDEVLGATILGEIGDIRRFDNVRKLVAYAGLDPSVYQSGRIDGQGGRISKRGVPLLRHSLHLAANTARQHDESFKGFYQKKLSEGKHYKVAITATSAKMLRVVYSILKDNKEYRPITS